MPDTPAQTPLMHIGWACALVGFGGSVLSTLPTGVANAASIGLSLFGLSAVVVGGRARDGEWVWEAGA